MDHGIGRSDDSGHSSIDEASGSYLGISIVCLLRHWRHSPLKAPTLATESRSVDWGVPSVLVDSPMICYDNRCMNISFFLVSIDTHPDQNQTGHMTFVD